MPRLLKMLDDIAVEKGRGVLFLDFPEMDDWRENPIRSEIVEWFKSEGIEIQDCFPPLGIEWLSYPYYGSFYMDVLFDENDPVYRKCFEKLENPDGTMRIEGSSWWYFDYEQMKKLNDKRVEQNKLDEAEFDEIQ